MLSANADPRYHHAPPRNGTDADRVIAASSRCGLVLDRWQADVLKDSLSRDAVGSWLTPRVAVSVPRQNGKGAIIEALELAFLLGAFPEATLLIHSAHEYKTAQNGFQRIRSFFETEPILADAVRQGRVKVGVSTAREFISVVGADGITRTIKFFARSKGSGRGFSADILILDEAQELSDDVWAAVLPTVSARPNPQIWLFGTPPTPTMNGEVFTRLRAAGVAGEDDRLAYFEWSAPKESDPADPSTWALANPAFGIRISEQAIRDESNSMDEDTFARERLGMWDDVTSGTVIPDDTWAALALDSDPVGRVVFAIDVSPDRSRASIGVAGWVGDDVIHVQTIENRKGVGWLPARLKELTERWPTAAVVVDTAGPAASLLPELKRVGIRQAKVQMLTTSEVARATGAFYDAVMSQRLAHPDQPLLNAAVAAARKRPLGDAWAWNRKDPTSDITPLVAVTFAAYGLAMKRRAAPDPSRRRPTTVL